ncbi:unnamed protein product, partial [Musa hybrid cultivar]
EQHSLCNQPTQHTVHMARKKVNLAWIANDSTRRATFKKRRKGLMKKVSELSTLCDVKACMIVYGPQEPHPEVWPSLPEATRVLARFKSMPEMEQCKKMMNQEGFLRQRVAKLQEQLRKQARENRELEVALLVHEGLAGRSLDDVSIEDATSLAWMVEMKAKVVHDRIERVRKEHVAAALRTAETTVATREKTPVEAAMEALQRQDWFMEVMNPNDHNVMFGGGDETIPSYIDHSSPWLDPYYPLN